MGLQFIFLAAGFLLLYYGAEWLVKGSASLARSLGISAVVIGLTVVAFGTSSPELVVSIVSSIKGRSMIAIGNVVGSNICNIALVLGMAAVLLPIRADRSVVRRDIPLMLAISVLLLVLSLDSMITRMEGGILFAGIILYTLFNYYQPKTPGGPGGLKPDAARDVETELAEIGVVESRPRQILLIVLGIAGVVGGAQVLIDAAVAIMKDFGVSEKFIGLTIVALGTSLPELATSIVAAMRKEMDISIGNLVGSNVFNILSVVGAAALVRPIPIPGGFVESGLVIDYGVMMGVSLLPWLMMQKDYTVRRSGGLILLGCYAAYIGYLLYRG